jgi:cytochrome c-type biogenesis protein CcmF
LLLLMAIGPLVAWRRASLRSLGRSFAWPAGIAVGVGLVLLLLGAGSSWIGLVAYTFSAFVLASITYEFIRGTRARRALMGGSWSAAFVELIARNRRRYGGYVVHASIVLLAIGVVGSSAYDTVRQQTLSRGQSMAVADYDLTYRRLVQRDGPNANELRAVVDVRRGGESLGSLQAGKNRYRAEDQVSNEVGIRSDYLTGEDLFVITENISANGTVVFKVFVKPLVNLIWFAGLVFFVGSLIALWPSAAEQRRLAARYRELRALARA